MGTGITLIDAIERAHRRRKYHLHQQVKSFAVASSLEKQVSISQLELDNLSDYQREVLSELTEYYGYNVQLEVPKQY